MLEEYEDERPPSEDPQPNEDRPSQITEVPNTPTPARRHHADTSCRTRAVKRTIRVMHYVCRSCIVAGLVILVYSTSPRSFDRHGGQMDVQLLLMPLCGDVECCLRRADCLSASTSQ